MRDFEKQAMSLENALFKLKRKMLRCNHLFVKQSEGYWIGGFHSSDYEYTNATVICLKCGLTNYHINMDPIARYQYDNFIKGLDYTVLYRYKVHDEIFKKKFYLGLTRDEPDYNLISNEVFKAKDPITLYQFARKIQPLATNDELFNIMKILYEIEKEEGKIVEFNEELIYKVKERMKDNKNKEKIYK